PPEHPTVIDHWGRQLNTTVGPHNEGDDVILTCRVIGGKPEPAVRWLVNGVLVDEEYEHNTGDVIENRLMWPSVGRQDLNSVFSCQAINTVLTEPREISLVLDIYLRPLTIRILSKQLPLVADRRYEVSCESAGSRPPAVITWYKGKRQLRRVKTDSCFHDIAISNIIMFIHESYEFVRLLEFEIGRLLEFEIGRLLEFEFEIGIRDWSSSRIRDWSSSRIRVCSSSRIRVCSSSRIRFVRLLEFEFVRLQEFEIGRLLEFEIGRLLEFEFGRLLEFEFEFEIDCSSSRNRDSLSSGNLGSWYSRNRYYWCSRTRDYSCSQNHCSSSRNRDYSSSRNRGFPFYRNRG
ncbi:hypothetical protein L9F63_011733, partial [Diploptera punctata]